MNSKHLPKTTTQASSAYSLQKILHSTRRAKKQSNFNLSTALTESRQVLLFKKVVAKIFK